MKLVAEFIADDIFTIKEPNYGISLCRLSFTNDMVERLSEYGLDTQKIADKIANIIEFEFYNEKYRPQ
jgi:hypothetical protein